MIRSKNRNIAAAQDNVAQEIIIKRTRQKNILRQNYVEKFNNSKAQIV
jgi:hypothetical protein